VNYRSLTSESDKVLSVAENFHLNIRPDVVCRRFRYAVCRFSAACGLTGAKDELLLAAARRRGPLWVMTRNTQVEQIASAVHSEAGHSILAYFPESAFAAPALRRIFEVFRRLFVVIPAASPWSSYRSEFLRENVGIQFLSLRQLLRA
jgi:hypothetical protein